MDEVISVLAVLNNHPEKYVVNKFIIDEFMKMKEVKAEIRTEARAYRNWGVKKYQKSKEAKLRKYRLMFRSLMSLLRKRKCIETISIQGKSDSFIKKMVITSPGMTAHEVVAHKITKVGTKVLTNSGGTNWKRRKRITERVLVSKMW